jgi:hypothetical protein
MPFPNDRTYVFDANLGVADGVSQITASGFTQYGGQPGIVDLGGNQGTSPKQQSRIDAVMVIDVTQLGVAAGNLARFSVVGSNDPGLATGNVELAACQVGGTGGTVPNAGASAAPGRIELFFTTQLMGLLYEFVGLYATIAGGGTVTAKAFVAVLPEP